MGWPEVINNLVQGSLFVVLILGFLWIVNR